MGDGMYRAGSGMLLEIRRQEVVAQNLAASNLPGYKRDFVVSGSFQDMLAREEGSTKTGKLQGTDGGQVRYDFTNGVLKKTDRSLDFAIDSYAKQSEDPTLRNGQIFFQVQNESGQTFLTKNGCFQLNSELTLITPDGMKVVDDRGTPITFGVDDNISDIIVSSDGVVKVQDRSVSPTVIKNMGNIQPVLVKDPQKLTRFSANYFMDVDGNAGSMNAPQETFIMKNGYYEDSNSSPIQEMNAMIQSVRQYEFHAKVVKSVQDAYRQEISKLTS